MFKRTTAQCLLFPDLRDKPIVAQLDQEHASSDGGAVAGLRRSHRKKQCSEASGEAADGAGSASISQEQKDRARLEAPAEVGREVRERLRSLGYLR